jgi:hypothetical protein
MKKVLFIYFLLIISCKNISQQSIKSDQVVDNFIGKTLLIPDRLKCYYPNDSTLVDSTIIFSAPLKVVSAIDGSCGACIETLSLWKKFIEIYKLRPNDISFLLIIESASGFETFNWIIGQKKLTDYPVFLDIDNTFSSLNHLPQSKIYHTFLINKKKEILLIGDPLRSKQLEELYHKSIDRALNQL